MSHKRSIATPVTVVVSVVPVRDAPFEFVDLPLRFFRIRVLRVGNLLEHPDYIPLEGDGQL